MHDPKIRELIAQEMGEILTEYAIARGEGERNPDSTFENAPEEVKEFLRDRADRVLALIPRESG